MKIAIIGGGASGLFCATQLSEHAQITIYEKNEKLGKKLLITGNGRCNVTNLKSAERFLQHVPVNAKFLFSCLHQFSPQHMAELLHLNNIELIEEEDNKLYPKLGKATAILNCFLNNLQKNVELKTLAPVTKIEHVQNKFYVTANNETLVYDKLIIATGGKSYPITGSTGEGYTFAKKLGHSISHLRQSLCGFITDKTIVQHCSGVSFECKASIVNDNNKILCSDHGHMMLTHFGVSGPLAFKLSSKFLGLNIENHFMELDILPHISPLELKKQLKDFMLQHPKKQIFEFIEPFLIKRFAQTLKQVYSNLLTVNCAQLSNEKQNQVLQLLKNLKIRIMNFDSFERAIVTRGGVNVSEIDPKSMQSKHINGLYFIGEVLNVDGPTGGYNLQIAFSTAYACAQHVNESLN